MWVAGGAVNRIFFKARSLADNVAPESETENTMRSSANVNTLRTLQRYGPLLSGRKRPHNHFRRRVNLQLCSGHRT